MRLARSRVASLAVDSSITSLLIAKPTSVKNVDADDSPAATMPANSIAPKNVGMVFSAAQIIALFDGSMSGFNMAMTGPEM